MSSINSIEETIQELNKLVSEETVSMTPLDAKSLATTVATIVMSDLADDSIDYACSVLFDPKEGILNFIRKAKVLSDMNINSAQSILLEFIAVLISRVTTSIQSYAMDIKNCCLSVSGVGVSSRVRCASIEALINLLDYRVSKIDISSLDVNDIYSRFKDQLFLPKGKLLPSVNGKVLELMGLISRLYPSIATDSDISFLSRQCYHLLDTNINDITKAGANALISSALTCLDHLMPSKHSHTTVDNNEEAERLFNATYQVFQLYSKLTRYNPLLSALQLFIDNIHLFSKMLVLNIDSLYHYLQIFCNHHDRNVHKLGDRAFDVFIKEISTDLYEKTTLDDKDRSILMLFMNHFMSKLEDNNNEEDMRSISMAIRGIGYFFKVCSIHLDRPYLDKLHKELQYKGTWFYSESNRNQGIYTSQLPIFIEAYTEFVATSNVMSNEFIMILQNMTDIFMAGFVQTSAYNRKDGIVAIEGLLKVLYAKGEGVLKSFLGNFFQKALLITCADTEVQDYETKHNYADMLYFWTSILKRSENQTLGSGDDDDTTDDEESDTMDIDSPDTRQRELSLMNYSITTEQSLDIIHNDFPEKLSDILYDSFMSSVLYLIKTFNLNLKSVASNTEHVSMEETRSQSTILSTALVPVNQKDFILFQNLVDFWCFLLAKIGHQHLSNWVYMMGSSFIELSLRYPLVSGFYKLMDKLISLMGTDNYFNGCKDLYSRKATYFSDTIDTKPNAYITYASFREYIREVWHKLQQYSDELLASCLHLVLTSSLFFETSELIIPLKKAFRLGVTYHPLATIALDKLDELINTEVTSAVDMEDAFFNEVLPCLNEYLLAEVNNDNEDEVSKFVKKKNYKLLTASARKREYIHAKTSTAQLGIIETEYTSLAEIQLRVLRLLGRLGGRNKSLLNIKNEDTDKEEILAWDSQKRLALKIPFAKVKLEIYFDDILPRICELAESSPERQVKIAACELLHGLILVMIGKAAFSAKDSRKSTKSEYHRIYLHVYPIMMRLAVDTDMVTRDMFRLLISQLIHWLTNNAYYENPETIALLQTCLDAVCSSNTGLRDYSAECIKEFVKWSIKQGSSKADGSMNIKSLLKRLYNFMTNSNSSKRFGASLVFNYIYREFREEEVLINQYSFELLSYLFYSLKIAESDHESIGTREQTLEAISHVKRILAVKSSIFIKKDNSRRAFPGFDSIETLTDLVNWAFIECGKLPRTYAKACLDLFAEFVLLVPGIQEGTQWLQNKLEGNPQFLTDVLESGELGIPSSSDSSERQLDNYTNWINRIHCATDGYIWLLERGLIDADKVIVQSSSHLLTAISYFIRNTPHSLLGEILHRKILRRSSIFSVYSYVSVRIVELLSLLLKNTNTRHRCLKSISECTDNVLLSRSFLNLLSSLLLTPNILLERIQLDSENSIAHLNANDIFTISKEFVDIMNKSQPSQFINELIREVGRAIAENNLDLINKDMLNDQSTILQQMKTLNCLQLLQEMGLLNVYCKEMSYSITGYPDTEQKYCSVLMQQFLNLSESTYDPVTIMFLGSTLKLIFQDQESAKKYASHLLLLSGSMSTISDIKKVSIIQKFNSHIYRCVANHFNVFSSVIATHLQAPSIKDFIIGLLEFFSLNRFSFRHDIFSFTDFLLENPDFLKQVISKWSNVNRISDLVQFMKYLFSADPGIMIRAKNKPVYDILFDGFISMLKLDNPSDSSNKVIDLLPIYISTDDTRMDTLSDTLRRAIVNKLSSEITNPNKNRKTYSKCITELDTLLSVMVRFKSVMVFKLLQPIIIHEDKNGHQEIIKSSMAKFAKGLDLKSFLEVTCSCFEVFKDKNTNIKRKLYVIEVLVSMFSLTDPNQISAFYEENIVYIMDIITRNMLVRGTNDELIADMKEKRCAFRLMEVLYQSLPVGMVHGPSSNISTLYENHIKKASQGKRMTLMLVSTAQKIRADSIKHDDVDLFRAQLSFNQSAYNAIASAVLRTQKLEKFFIGFLFKETPSEPIWSNIIDINQQIRLSDELDRPLITTSLEDFRAISGFRLQKENNSNVSYMASVALSGSSLSQFTLADRILQESNMDESLSGNNLDEAVDTLSESSNTKDTLELDIFNRNPCMRLLTEVIKKLHTEITPPEKELGAMPSWMGEIYRKFNDYGSTLALKLYLAKLIINYPQAFENYASFWLIPLVEIASRGSEFGEPINYFVQDLCTLIITWGRSINPCEKYQDKYALYTFVKVLMGSAYHDHSRILRNNIQIIKGIFDNWGQSIIISTETIYRQFTHTNEDSKKNIVGLQLTGIVLAHGLNPYYNGNGSDLKGLTEFQFYTSMSNNIFGKHLKAVSDTAELMGWSLEYVKKFNHQLYGEMFDLYVKRLTKILHGKDENSNRFIMAVNRVSLHNLDIPRIFLQKVIFKLPQLVGKPLIQAIEIVTACSEDDSKIIQQFNSIGILRVLQYRNDDSQLAILRFLYKLSPVMEEKDFKSILPIIIKLFTSHHNVECRNIYYKILQARYLVSKDDPKIKDELMAALLRGLVDKYLAISDSVYVFIQECNGINDDTNMNITKILREMYLPSLEDIYLLYSTRMILKGTENSYEYDKPVFDKPLPNARFDANYINMNTSWQRSANMTPLFAATQNTVINPEELELNIRATQNSLAFSQTQAENNSLYSAFGSSQENAGNYTLSQSIGFSHGESSQAISEGKNDYSQLRKRFIKSGKSSSNFFIRRQEDLQKQLRTYLNVKKETQEKKITLLRKYRYGELPDIQICYLDLLKPLGLLAGKDYHISRLLYGSLVVATVENESESYKADIISILETNMDRSTLYFTPTIGTFLRICIDLKVTGISSKLVKRVSTRSSNHHMGITLMENVLSHNTEERLKKRSRTTDGIEGNKKKDWINMSLLFKDIDEPEMFESIYQYNVASSDLTQEAIEAETRGQYARAFNLFHKAKSDSLDDALDEERDLWDKEMLHCYEKLLQWGDIANKIEEIIPDRNYECLWDSKYQDPYMSYFIKSFTKLRNQHREQSSSEILPWTDENPNPIFAFLEATYNSNERQKYLIDNYASDVAAAAVMKHKYEYGLEIVRSSYTSLLSVWTMLHPLADSSRKNKLASLERIVELEDYIFLAKDVKQIEMASEKVVKFLNPLYRRSPDAITDSIDIWDDIMETRMMFLEDLSFNLDIESLVSLESTFHQAKRNFLKAMSDAALEQKNSNVVFTKLQALQEMGDHNSFDMGTIKYYQNELENMMIDPTQKNGIIVRALYKSLTYTLPDNSNALQSFDYYISLAKTFDIIKVQIIADPVSFTSLKKSKAITKMVGKEQIEDSSKLLNFLEKNGHDNLEKAMVASKENSTLHTECIWRFGQYCDSSLKIASNSFGNSPLDINRIKYSTLVVESYMKAMDCGHIEAAKTFPRLLELIELYSEAGEAFRIQSESFSSTWLYIKWIPQLVALLDSSLATYIYPAVQKIAIEYPNALYYPFRISNEQYELIKHELPSINQEIVEKIKNNLKSPIMEEFCLELKRLTDPEHLLKDFIDYLQSIVYDDKINPSFGNDFYHQLDDLLLNISSSRLGSIGKAFAKNHGHQIIRIIGKNGRNLLSSPSEVIKKLQLYLQDVVSNTKSTARNNADLLKSYSPWLASFKGNDYTEKIEVPGQYDGKGKPQPDNHVMISGFDGRLLVMNSMRKPKRICIYGSDGKEYMFLVKGGEDLRLDQRIEQLFSVMNEIVGRNSYCSIYNLRIATYNITPMAGNLGLIEWVNNTIPLRRCIEDQLTNKMQMTRIQDNYRRWIKKHAGSSAKPMDGYQKSFGANRSDVTSTYQQISRQIQPTVLKDYLMKLASSPEAFIFIRRYFAHSLACISIFGYILGIGDRHLENFLLDLSSGRLIPIDFGHAFGSATELLPVPELVPFRMTPQLVGVLEPLGICNLLETPMINLLSAIQANKDLLLNTMTVFVKEPSLDWKKAAIKYSKSKKHISSMDSNKSSFHSKEDVKWYPENKIEIAKRKLDGDNPAYIVTTELTNGHENQFYYDSVTKLARGDTENNIRARVKERCESVKQQVDCLIDLATDPHILGTMWVGWQSFV